jgi:hypothetical protein
MGPYSLLVKSLNRYAVGQLRTTSLYGNANDVSSVTMETLEADLIHSRLFILPRKTPAPEKLSPNHGKSSGNTLLLTGDESKGEYNWKGRLGPSAMQPVLPVET